MPALTTDRNLFTFVGDVKLNVHVLTCLIPRVSAFLWSAAHKPHASISRCWFMLHFLKQPFEHQPSKGRELGESDFEFVQMF
jgi:hypothetical protein